MEKINTQAAHRELRDHILVIKDTTHTLKVSLPPHFLAWPSALPAWIAAQLMEGVKGLHMIKTLVMQPSNKIVNSHRQQDY